MAECGWLTRDESAEFAGTYCLACAALLRLVRWSESCSHCGVAAGSETEAERDGWRYFVDGWGELVPFCAVCVASEFGIAPPRARGNGIRTGSELDGEESGAGP